MMNISNEGEKNETIKRKIFLSLKIICLIFIYISFFFYISLICESFYINRKSDRSWDYNALHAHEHNVLFEKYKGNSISAIEVLQLLSEINKNNIVEKVDEEYLTIGVLLRYNKEEENYGYVPSNTLLENNDFKYTANTNEIKRFIKSNSTYKVTIPNTKAYDSDKFENDGFEEDGKLTINNSAFYTNGYIRLFYIEENLN